MTLIGGAMAFTFLKALGYKTGTSPVEDDQLDYAKNCFLKANGKIVLPCDTVISDAFDPAERTTIQTVKIADIGDAFEGLDVGPETRKSSLLLRFHQQIIFLFQDQHLNLRMHHRCLQS